MTNSPDNGSLYDVELLTCKIGALIEVVSLNDLIVFIYNPMMSFQIIIQTGVSFLH
jgi:hypothetical protein